ncbi:MAG: SPFH domain-containing protein [Anaerolineales bacterium]|nr:SPFH domain-containing protein [Anaerolineales bacterium]
MIWTIGIGLLVLVMLITAYFLWNTTAFIIFTAFIFATVVVGVFLKYAVVHLNELEVGVVFDRWGNFSRFLDSGRHFINPFLERMTAKMTKGTRDATGTTSMIRTKEGVPVTVTWSVSFRIEYQRIPDNIKYKMARALPKNAEKMVGGKALRALRHNIERKGIAELHSDKAIQTLEAELCQEIFENCKAYGLVEIPPQDVKIGPIVMPEHVEKAIEAAYERKLTVEGMNALREVLDSFNDDHMERLNTLERFRLFYDTKVDFYLMESVSSGETRRAPGRGAMPGMAPGGNGGPLDRTPQGPRPPRSGE